MGVTPSLWKKIGLIARHKTEQRSSRVLSRQDPDLLAIAEIAQQRRLDAEQSLEALFEKIRPILRRGVEWEHPAQASELPSDLKSRIMAIPDPEQRIRAIVEFKLSHRKRPSHQG
jgi:hypothetical protein